MLVSTAQNWLLKNSKSTLTRLRPNYAVGASVAGMSSSASRDVSQDGCDWQSPRKPTADMRRMNTAAKLEADMALEAAYCSVGAPEGNLFH